MASSELTSRPWQRTGWSHALAIVLGVTPIYAMTIVTDLNRTEPYGLDGILFYTCVIAGLALVWLLFLLRWICGERLGDLNLRQARWWQDVLGGLGLTLVILGVLISAALFGLAHLYQGPAGMANTALSGLILAVVYLRFGRVWPLVISHYLHDTLQIGLVVYLMHTGAR